ncbi:type II secretion system secretin GspD [Phenylobacterium sp. J426]|uniref:type II secretion system secretin GspD n=1 Tax=Phenylobacterium sp. J426 TaxID=2898439 RepID=UPI002151D847|nr:type II secretion system secretin GspD [Phenylobacterium sp. J426]MCR5874053.1 type II secretion system secretin GspD [Phenylobacterium sp. J426]
MLSPLAPPVAHAQSQVLNLQDADIRIFIQDVARVTGRTFIIDPRVQGKVSVVSQEPLSRNELFDVLMSTLRANGLVAVPTGSGAYRIAPEEGAATQPASLGASAGYGFATQVFRLRNLDATSAADTLKPLVGRQGAIQAVPRGNMIVVADYADNLRRIRGLLGQIDQDRGVTETITLKSSSAREIAGVLNDLLKGPGADPAARNGVVSIVVVESSNSIILKGEAEAIRPLLDVVADLDRRAETAGDVRVVQLQHANAEQLVPVLQQLVGQPVTAASPAMPSGRNRPGAATAVPAEPPPAATAAPAGPQRANIARYPGANAIVIAADPDTQRMLAEVIRQLDVRRRQVLVEAIVVEVSDEAAKRLGVQFAVAGLNGSAIPFTATTYGNAQPNLPAIIGAVAAEKNLPDDDDTKALLRDAAVRSLLGATGMTVGGGGQIGNDALFGVVINAVKSDTASNLLSTPSIMTLDNQPATLLVGQEVPITTGESLGVNNENPFRTISRQNVGVQLEVTPQINAGGTITLFLRQEVSSVAGPVSNAFSELVLNKREIETTVNVDDGEIIVLGGLLDQNERVSVEKTPLLGDIPGLGNLFRGTAKAKTKTNLMVFIRPKIVGDAAQARAATAPKYEYIADQQAARDPARQAELERLVRDYLRAEPPTAPPPASSK